MSSSINKKQYDDLTNAYSYFNKKLFENKLPECLITFQRKSRARGYYSHERFSKRNGSEKVSEIALNPDTFEDRTDMEILSTLVHEMCHVQQYHFGEPSRKGYHNREFAEMMSSIGLQCSHNGEVGGKTTGQSMTHYIIENGLFEKVVGAFLLSGDKIHWNSFSLASLTPTGERNKTREKFVCTSCLQNAWAKKTANLMCGECGIHMVIEED